MSARPRLARARADEAVVEGHLRLTDEARARLAEVVADFYADILLDAFARQERGVDPIEAIRAALAAAEGSQ